MRSKDKTLMAAIEKFVSDYTDSNGTKAAGDWRQRSRDGSPT